MVKRKDNTGRIRRVVGVAAAVVVVAVVAVGLFYQGDAGADYRTLDRPDDTGGTGGTGGTGKVRVVEYFSYGCPHCRNLERVMEGWPERLPDGVAFERVHVAYSTATRTLARAHHALKRHDALDANHERIFSAIHDRGRHLTTPAALADFVQGHGVERDAFLATMRAPAVARQVAAAEKAFASLGLSGVPALVVDGKYVVNMDLGRKRSLDVAAKLAGELAAKRAK